jgi:hypothetical protein
MVPASAVETPVGDQACKRYASGQGPVAAWRLPARFAGEIGTPRRRLEVASDLISISQRNRQYGNHQYKDECPNARRAVHVLYAATTPLSLEEAA